MELNQIAGMLKSQMKNISFCLIEFVFGWFKMQQAIKGLIQVQYSQIEANEDTFTISFFILASDDDVIKAKLAVK